MERNADLQLRDILPRVTQPPRLLRKRAGGTRPRARLGFGSAVKRCCGSWAPLLQAQVHEPPDMAPDDSLGTSQLGELFFDGYCFVEKHYGLLRFELGHPDGKLVDLAFLVFE